MAQLQFGNVPFDADIVVFDKDGTLLDFEFMWGRLAMIWVEHLAVAGGPALRQDLYDYVGYDSRQQRTRPSSPLAIASNGELQTIIAAVLCRHGTPWPQAQDRARQAFEAGADLPLADLIRPAGDVAGLLARLQAAGVRVAVVTTDDRAGTEETLRLLGADTLVDTTLCGDDGLPIKPAPDMFLAACRQVGVAPARAAVVGDTLGDLLMARRAGAGLAAAVLTGADDLATLRPEADVVLASIDEIVALSGHLC